MSDFQTLTQTSPFESFQQLSTESLATIYWDWYKDVNGFRPRHMKGDERQMFLDFIEYELRPEVIARREFEYQQECEYYDELERQHNAQMEEYAQAEREAKDLESAYDTTYYYIEERFH